MNSNFDNIFHKRPKVVPQIYGYIIPELKSNEGYIKIGYTDREDVNIRIKEQTHQSGAQYKIVLCESAMRPDGTCFTDYDVHKILTKKGFSQLNEGQDKNEWYKCTVDDVLSIINEIKTGKSFSSTRKHSFEMRYEQKEAVKKTKQYFLSSKKDNPNISPKFLWNAKMRFGKTFTSYQLAKEMNMTRILILTFKPAIEDSWQEDLLSHKDFEGWQFISDKEAKIQNKKLDDLFFSCDKEKPIVVFGSLQNLLGENENGGIKAKNEFIHNNKWDLIIFDEFHFGAWRPKTQDLFKKTTKEENENDFDYEKYHSEDEPNSINETWIQIETDYYLYLSGTPFRALNNGEFIEEQIFNWTYTDEQLMKEKNINDPNSPYTCMPKMVILAYKIPDTIIDDMVNAGYDEFDINEFFRAKYENNNVKNSRFVYENAVQKWINMIKGEHKNYDILKLGNEKSPMPFSDTRFLDVLSHTLWYLPNVSSCYAMYNLLKQKQNNFFNDYNVIVCAGKEPGEGSEALKYLRKHMGNPLETKTITLSCGKLTTGVTVKPWTGVFMLRKLNSPESYFQTAFRVQTPWEIKDDKFNKKNLKQECYIFDFALNRCFKQISDYSCRLDSNDASPEEKVSNFLSFLPIYAFTGSEMIEVSAKDVLDIAYAGTSGTLLAKSWQSSMLVNVDNNTLQKLLENNEVLNSLMNIESFRTLNEQIEIIINKTEKIKKLATSSENSMPKKEKTEIDEEQNSIKSVRKKIQSNLLKLATRIPIFMYLTDYRENCIKDVITKIEPDLFKKVTGLNISDFDFLCSIGIFNPQFMNESIFRFRRYEDSSLVYAGINKHANEDVGGWDTTIKRQEFEELMIKQQNSMNSSSDTIFYQNLINYENYYGSILNDKENNLIINEKEIEEKLSYIISDKNKTIPMKIMKLKENDDVQHEEFGVGKVLKFLKNKKYVDIKFEVGTKRFPFPNSFLEEKLKIID